MVSSFFDRIDELSDAVGHGTVSVSVEVDQVYAHYQEVGAELSHPRGGMAFALREASVAHADKHMETLAGRAVTEDGSHLREAAIDVSEATVADYYELAPRDYDDLRDSGHPKVTDEGAIVYDRPPVVARLTEAELRLKHHGERHRARHRAS